MMTTVMTPSARMFGHRPQSVSCSIPWSVRYFEPFSLKNKPRKLAIGNILRNTCNCNDKLHGGLWVVLTNYKLMKVTLKVISTQQLRYSIGNGDAKTGFQWFTWCDGHWITGVENQTVLVLINVLWIVTDRHLAQTRCAMHSVAR